MVLIPESGSFSLSAYVTSPGYQTIPLSGFLYKRIGDQTYVAPLLPQFFYGVDGKQLGHTWRQYIPAAGEQTILSRVAGKPEPLEEIYWRKVSDREAKEVEKAEAFIPVLPFEIPEWWPYAALALGALVTVGYLVWKVAG